MSKLNEKHPAAVQSERARNGINEPAENSSQTGKFRCQPGESAKVTADSKTEKAADPVQNTADKLVELALARYRVGRAESNEPFSVENDGPNVALMLRGSQDSLRSLLSRDYRRKYGKTPNSAALADAITVLQGEAQELAPEPVHLRVAEYDDKIVIDLGDSTGRAIVVSPGTWEVVDRSPVLFRRTALTGELPIPKRGGDLQELRQLLNVTEDTWPLVLGWLVAAFYPNMSHPILMMGGQQGTGKTTAAKKLVGLVDPSPAPVRSAPKGEDQWAVTSSCSWVVAVDNVSFIPNWWSDALCRTVTGDGWLKRRLYTDGDPAVLSFRRVVLLTSIDSGALRGDLGDRVLLIDLETIDDASRRTEQEIDAEYGKVRPCVFGALLDVLSKVLAKAPDVQLNRMPRMADFSRLLATIDTVLDSQSLDLYLGQGQRIAETVIDSDPVALAIVEFLDEMRSASWEGTTAELLRKITPDFPRPTKSWPRTPQVLGGRLARLEPALKQLGIVVTRPPRTGNRRTLKLTRATNDNRVTTDGGSGHVDCHTDCPGMINEVGECDDDDRRFPHSSDDYHLNDDPSTWFDND